MRGRTLVLSSLLLLAVGPWGCKVSVGDGDLDNSFDEEEERDAGAKDSGTAGKSSKPPKAGSGAAGSGSTVDGGVAGNGSQAGRGGSSSAGTSGGAGSGSLPPVPGTTMLSDLDEADAAALCQQFASEVATKVTDEQIARVNCTLDALILVLTSDPDGEVDVEACEAEADSCIEDGLGEIMTECDVDEIVAMTADCDATVKEYLDCNRGVAEQFADFEFTCASFVDPMAAEDAILALDTDKIPACVSLLGKCPELGGGQ